MDRVPWGEPQSTLSASTHHRGNRWTQEWFCPYCSKIDTQQCQQRFTVVSTQIHSSVKQHCQTTLKTTRKPNLRRLPTLSFVRSNTSCQNYFCRTAKFAEDILNNSQAVASVTNRGKFLVWWFWPWPLTFGRDAVQTPVQNFMRIGHIFIEKRIRA